MRLPVERGRTLTSDKDRRSEKVDELTISVRHYGPEHGRETHSCTLGNIRRGFYSLNTGEARCFHAFHIDLACVFRIVALARH